MNCLFDNLEDACDEVLKLRSQCDMLKKEYIEILCMVRTGATAEQLDIRLRNALAASGTAMLPER